MNCTYPIYAHTVTEHGTVPSTSAVSYVFPLCSIIGKSVDVASKDMDMVGQKIWSLCENLYIIINTSAPTWHREFRLECLPSQGRMAMFFPLQFSLYLLHTPTLFFLTATLVKNILFREIENMPQKFRHDIFFSQE